MYVVLRRIIPTGGPRSPGNPGRPSFPLIPGAPGGPTNPLKPSAPILCNGNRQKCMIHDYNETIVPD